MLQTIVLEILAAAVVYICIAVTIQRKLVDMPKMYAMQAEMQLKSKELQELSKSGASQDILMQKQSEVSKLLMTSMKSQFKPILVVVPMFLVVYYYLLPLGFGGQAFPTIIVPLLGTLSYQRVFFYTVFVLGLVLSLSLQWNDKRKMAKPVPVAGTPT